MRRDRNWRRRKCLCHAQKSLSVEIKIRFIERFSDEARIQLTGTICERKTVKYFNFSDVVSVTREPKSVVLNFENLDAFVIDLSVCGKCAKWVSILSETKSSSRINYQGSIEASESRDFDVILRVSRRTPSIQSLLQAHLINYKTSLKV